MSKSNTYLHKILFSYDLQKLHYIKNNYKWQTKLSNLTLNFTTVCQKELPLQQFR